MRATSLTDARSTPLHHLPVLARAPTLPEVERSPLSPPGRGAGGEGALDVCAPALPEVSTPVQPGRTTLLLILNPARARLARSCFFTFPLRSDRLLCARPPCQKLKCLPSPHRGEGAGVRGHLLSLPF
jgi:hypothetical protein